MSDTTTPEQQRIIDTTFRHFTQGRQLLSDVADEVLLLASSIIYQDENPFTPTLLSEGMAEQIVRYCIDQIASPDIGDVEPQKKQRGKRGGYHRRRTRTSWERFSDE